MSTTPSISDIPYTIVGGTRVQPSRERLCGICAIILDRGSRTVHSETLERVFRAGVDETVVVLGPSPHYDVEQLARKLQGVRFILLTERVTAGTQINIGIHESSCNHIAVMWSDSELGIISDRTLVRLQESEALCVVPTVRSERGTVVPSVTAPAFYGTKFRTIPAQPGTKGDSLYPYDYMAIYDRARFVHLGGFDRSIINPYWQLLDFGFRGYLWGERISVLPGFRIDATRAFPPVDTTLDASYARFYLKNLAVRFAGDSGKLSSRRLLTLISRSGLGPFEAIRLFQEARKWVKENRYRFCQDARRITELWEVDE